MAESEQRGFEDLECYKLALSVVREAYQVARRLPPEERYNLADQLRRAAVSITLNIAEGYGRYHYLDSLRFSYIARGSLNEVLSAFITCDTVRLLTDELSRQRELCHSAMRALNGYIRYVRGQRQGHQEYGERMVREDGPIYSIAPEDPDDDQSTNYEFTNLPTYQLTPRLKGDSMTTLNKTAVVAVGGNALILDKAHEDVASQVSAVEETCKHIADMIVQGWNVVVTHGNGPQVGFILRRNELAYPEVHSTPLDVIGADTQGAIGYMIARALDNDFKKRGIQRNVAAVVTQVLVDRNDPGFKNPTKGIGGFTTQEKAEIFQKEGWIVKEDAGRGWRRMIASPIPLKIVEFDAIKTLIDNGFIVAGVGGGGIPVIENEQGELQGVFAVIDKDRASSLLAAELKADLLLISTAVEKVALNFNKPDQKNLDRMTLSEAKQYYKEGHFLSGSMGPKIEAIIAFLEANPNGQGLITDPPHIVEALNGKTGTWIVQD